VSADPVAVADAALQLVGTNPRRAQRLATDAARTAREARDLVAESRAHRALGLAALELGRLDEAADSLRTAVRRGRRSGVPLAVAEARMSLAYVLLERGATDAALAEADRAASGVRGEAAVRLLGQRALLLQRCGRTSEALAAYRRALPRLREGQLYDEARLRYNRGALLFYTGRLDAAESDFVRAGLLYERLALDLFAADVQVALGNVAARRGDVPLALERFDATQAIYRRHGAVRMELLLSRVELLLSVGLSAEAREAADRAVAELERDRRPTLLAEALLSQAQAALQAGDTEASHAAATRAARMFTRQKRPGWAVVARYVALRAEERAGRLSRALRTRALRVAEELATIGWRAQELDARLIAARVAMELGDLATVRRELQRTAAARTRGPTELRIRAWYAEAMRRLATGRQAAAETALRAGFRVMERQRATLGATELRVHVAGHAGDLANLGLDLAWRSGSPRKVLDWAERWRAGALGLRPIRPPEDVRLADALADLRRASGEAEAALLEGRPADRLLARRAALEDRVRRYARRAAGPLFTGQVDPPPADEVAAGLRDRVLVELIGYKGTLLAITLRDGEPRLHELGQVSVVRRALDALLFGLRRLAVGHGSAASLASARAAVAAHSARMDAALLEPLRAAVTDRPLVVVPTGSLRSTPWSLLPSCTGRPVTVSPSAAMWLRAVRRPPERSAAARVVLVSGPGLDGGAAEINQLAAQYRTAVRLNGSQATVEITLAALDGADVAHIAAHGRLRRDNPLFSALELADGPLTVYDLERLAEAPRLVLLPACQSGIGSEFAGDEVMGLTSALFALGTRTAVATVIPVPDEATRPLMLALHAGLHRGLSTADALAVAQAATDPDDVSALATAGGFVCYGAG
jgi:tetratricopeptide (TPR) repeat protein